MYVMYDSVSTAEIPASAPAVAGYVGGAWPTYNALAERWPRAHKISIAVNASEDAECLDIENGDATPNDAPDWFRRQRARGVSRPCFYTSLSQVQELLAVLNQADIHRTRTDYRLWTAHYTNRAHVCSRADGCPVDADATQWTDAALGRNLDESLCLDAFFAPRVGRPYVPQDEARWIRECDQLQGRRRSSWALRRLRRVMTARRKEIWRLAQADNGKGWEELNRRARYQALLTRTEC